MRRTFGPLTAVSAAVLVSWISACGGSGDTTAPSSATAPSSPGTSTTPSTPTPAGSVSLSSHNATQPTVAGSAFQYDATKAGTAFTDGRGGGLTYAVSFTPANAGVTALAGRISGVIGAPGLVNVVITATDGGGRTAADTFDIIAFAPGLTSPTLDGSFQYVDAVNVPRHFVDASASNNDAGPGGLVSLTDNLPGNNAVTNAGAALGRVLFYDPRLSGNDATSCSSCHVQSTGFADTARLSRGFRGGLTGRHSMALGNARYYTRGRFFWDERAVTLEDQVLRPIQDTVEMGMALDLLEKKLAVTSYYPALFQAAFGSSTITRERISFALAQFVRTLVTGNSKFDLAVTAAGGANTVLTAQEVQGRGLFASAGCARCHTTFGQIGDDVHNTGLDATIADVGAGNGRFKTPSLRNVAVRGRFMHDGRFTSLDEVVEFYNSGVQANPGLDIRLRVGGGRGGAGGGAPAQLGLTTAEKAALVAFLRTLTDDAFLANPKFASPFPR